MMSMLMCRLMPGAREANWARASLYVVVASIMSSCAIPPEQHAIIIRELPVHTFTDVVFFVPGSTTVSSVRAQKLVALSLEQQRWGAACLEVTGFADQGERDPERLSVLRASEVIAILNGVTPRVPASFDGRGATHPMSPPHDKGYDPHLNARVELIWHRTAYATDCLRRAATN